MWYLAAIYLSEQDLNELTRELDAEEISFEVRRKENSFEVYVENPQIVAGVKQFQSQQGLQKKYALSLSGLKQTPVTTMILFACFATALITWLGQQYNQYFYIAIMNFDPRSWTLYEGPSLLWHSLSPIFLHFSIEHLVFNALLFWFLSIRLEHVIGRNWLMIGILVISIVSNYAQLLMTGPLFGGLSGVVYGLLGFVFAFQKHFTNLGVSNGLFYFSLAWLLLGMTNVFAIIGLFNMANTAHLSGLISGFAVYAIYYLINKRRQYEH